MFGFFRNRKRDQAMLANLMEAAAEGNEREKINQSVAFLGINAPEIDDSTTYCSEISSSFVKQIINDSTDNNECLSRPSCDAIFAGGVYLLTVCDYFSQRVGAPFEQVFLFSFLTLFQDSESPETISKYITPVTNTFNDAAQNTKAIQALGDHVDKFIQSPSHDTYNKLISIYQIFLDNIK